MKNLSKTSEWVKGIINANIKTSPDLKIKMSQHLWNCVDLCSVVVLSYILELDDIYKLSTWILNITPFLSFPETINSLDIFAVLALKTLTIPTFEDWFLNPDQDSPSVKVFDKSIIRIDESYMMEDK